MRIIFRLRLLKGLSLLGLAALGGLLIWSMQEFAATTANNQLLNTIHDNVFSAASLRDQYFLHRDTRSRDQWDSQNRQLARRIAQALAQFEDPAERQVLKDLQRTLEDSSRIFLRIVANTEALQSAGSNRAIYEELDKRLLSQLLVQTSVLYGAAVALDQSGQQRADLAYRQMLVSIALGAAALTLFIVLTLFFIDRLIRRRLSDLHAGARAVASGRLDIRLQDQGADELAEVARSINSMTEQLEDITKRKAMETAQRESEQRFRDLLSNVRMLAVMVDAQGNITFCNDFLLELTGWQRDEVLGKSWFKYFLSESSRKQTLSVFASSFSNNAVPPHYENQVVTRGGEQRLIAWDVTVLRDLQGEIVGTASIGVDITERRRAEQRLRESEHFFRESQRAGFVGSYKIDFMTGFWESSEVLDQIFGIDTAFVRSIQGWRDLVHPEDAEMISQYMRAETIAKSRQFNKEYRIVRRSDGETRWILARGEPAFDAAGQLISLTGTVQDVSERKLAEKMRDTLEAQLRESQKMEAIGTLAGGVAHEFNNLLAMIFGNVELARQDVAEDSEVRLSIEEISKAAERAKKLVQQILAFSRRNATEMVNQPLRPILDDSLQFLRPTLPSGVELALAIADAPIHARCDANQIEQVLINLCNNAWQSMAGHAGRIELGMEQCVLDEKAAQRLEGLTAGSYARVWVSDNGCGMDEATQARMFEPFFTTKQVGQGTGLGLSVVHGIIKAHQGAIEIQSAPGRGTTVTIYLPLSAVAGRATQPVDRPLAAAGSGQHVLYLDDETSLVLLVRRLLTRLGYRASGYTSAQEALEAVRGDPDGFDLVVTDFNMPGKSGLDVAREVHRIRADLPVVIASGYITEQLLQDAAEIGVRQVVFKPNTVDELCGVIRDLLAADAVRID